jgi:hypothetical protein
MSSPHSGHFKMSSKTENSMDKSINIVPSLTVSKFSLLLTKFSFCVPILAPEGPAKLSQGSPCLKIFDFLDGGLLIFFSLSVLDISHLIISNYDSK